MNKGRPTFKFKSLNKKIESKKKIYAQCECKKIVLKKKDKNITR